MGEMEGRGWLELLVELEKMGQRLIEDAACIALKEWLRRHVEGTSPVHTAWGLRCFMAGVGGLS
jgi:hypothetical protein